jgi:hypothetical protein
MRGGVWNGLSHSSNLARNGACQCFAHWQSRKQRLLPRYYFLLLRTEITGDQRRDTSPSGRKRCTVTGQTSLVSRCDFTQIIATKVGHLVISSPLHCDGPDLPRVTLSPPDETVVAGGAWAIAIRQIAPWCAGSQHPADAVEDTSIVHTTHASRLVRQHRPYGRPFIIREFVAHHTRLPFWSMYNVQRGTINRQRSVDSTSASDRDS